MPPFGFLWRVISSKFRPFLATKSANLSAVLFSSAPGSGSSAISFVSPLEAFAGAVSGSNTYSPCQCKLKKVQNLMLKDINSLIFKLDGLNT